jgi:hypothetical protein
MAAWLETSEQRSSPTIYLECKGEFDGRRLQPICISGRMARTVTVPPVTGVLIRARKVPEHGVPLCVTRLAVAA